ncbi:MAG: GH116 family glycosyl-hydrolase [Bacteroidota bacterium]
MNPLPCVIPVVFALLVAVAQSSNGSTPAEKQRVFTGQSLQEIAFPLGGIGTGCISLGGRGDLRDWEIFNKPAKGSRLDFTFFALWARQKGHPPIARILERRFIPPYRGGGFGMAQRRLSGLPRLEEAAFQGSYPFAKVNFRDNDLPVTVSLEAWSPFIPLNVDDSALPVAIFAWKLSNPYLDTVEVSLASCISNPIGSRYTDVNGKKPGIGKNLNEFIDEGDFQGIKLSSQKVPKDDPNFGTIALVTPHRLVDVQTRWYRGGWWDPCHIFWDDLSDNGRVKEVRDAVVSDSTSADVSSLVLRAVIPPGGSVTLPLMITWHFPNRENYWNGEKEVRGKLLRNYVASRFTDAWDVARYVVKHASRLESETRAFHDALFSSTLPLYVLDAVSSQMSTLKSTVCMLLDDGSFFGFEGVADEGGCCPLNCTHVWNYEQALAYLFPKLERSMRETDFLYNTLPFGYMTFRTLIPLGTAQWKFKPCADGQMGSIVRAYRDWKLSGDTGWLKRLWPKIKSALEFAWKGTGPVTEPGKEWTWSQLAMPWDSDKDGVMDAEQHNTYDIEFYGPNTMTGSLYLAALKAGAEMATTMKDADAAKEYNALFAQGSRRYDSLLWNGEYYTQRVTVSPGLRVPKELESPVEEECDSACVCKTKQHEKALRPGEVVPKYQYGTGCLADQLLGQYLAHVVGLGYVLDPLHVRKAMAAIARYNLKTSLDSFANVQRVYALNDESGLVLCTWPKGDRPALPFPYSDEVWTGIEYQVAATLVYNGLVEEGAAIVKAVRDRYDGLRRNPWDEEECGHHYARAMSSWALLLAYSGFSYDGTKGAMGFAPAGAADHFTSFWSCGTGWGTVTMEKGKSTHTVRIEQRYGSLLLRTLALPAPGLKVARVRASLAGKPVSCSVEAENPMRIRFSTGITLQAGDALILEY